MQGEGVDFRGLSKQIGHKVVSVKQNGSRSASKFCQLWHVCKSGKKPRFAIIVTRSNTLNRPVYRASRAKRLIKGDSELSTRLEITAGIELPVAASPPRKSPPRRL